MSIVMDIDKFELDYQLVLIKCIVKLTHPSICLHSFDELHSFLNGDSEVTTGREADITSRPEVESRLRLLIQLIC